MARPRTIGELITRFELNQRTIYRYLDELVAQNHEIRAFRVLGDNKKVLKYHIFSDIEQKQLLGDKEKRHESQQIVDSSHVL